MPTSATFCVTRARGWASSFDHSLRSTVKLARASRGEGKAVSKVGREGAGREIVAGRIVVAVLDEVTS